VDERDTESTAGAGKARGLGARSRLGLSHPLAMAALLSLLGAGGWGAWTSTPALGEVAGPEPVLHAAFSLLAALLLVLYLVTHNRGHALLRTLVLATLVASLGAMSVFLMERALLPGSGLDAGLWPAILAYDLAGVLLVCHWALRRAPRRRANAATPRKIATNRDERRLSGDAEPAAGAASEGAVAQRDGGSRPEPGAEGPS